jgi:streptogramin lyase
MVGKASASLVLVPTGVHCVSIQVTNGTSSTESSFDVNPETSASFALSGLPLGADTFVASASAAECGDAGASPATFESTPVTVNVAAGASPTITLAMQPVADSGGASVGVTFPAPTSGVVTEFTLPNGFSARGLAAGPDGNLWLPSGFSSTNTSNQQIVKLTTSGSATVYTIGPFVDPPAGEVVTAGADGNIWFLSGNAFGSTDGGLTQFGLQHIAPDGTGLATFNFGTVNTSFLSLLTVGGDGTLWIVDSLQNAILHVSLSFALMGKFPLPTPKPTVAGIAFGADGALWFTEMGVIPPFVGPPIGNGKVARLDPSTGQIVEFPVPGSPNGIAAGPDGNLWATSFSNPSPPNYVGSVLQITPQGAVTAYAMPAFNPDPTNIVAGPDGNMWFLEEGSANSVGRFRLSDSTFTEYPIPTDTYQYGLVVGSDGNLWFAELGGKVGRIAP